MFGWQIENLFIVVERSRIFVGREIDVVITKSSCCQKNVNLEEKRNGKIGFSVNVSFCTSEVGVGKVIDCVCLVS